MNINVSLATPVVYLLCTHSIQRSKERWMSLLVASRLGNLRVPGSNPAIDKKNLEIIFVNSGIRTRDP